MHFNAEIASIYVAPEEEVAGIGGMATELEQCHEIMLRYGKLTGSDRTNGRMRKGSSRIDRRCHRRLQESIKTNKREKQSIRTVWGDIRTLGLKGPMNPVIVRVGIPEITYRRSFCDGRVSQRWVTWLDVDAKRERQIKNLACPNVL